MNKLLRYSLVALLGLICGNVYADDITDVLTWEGLGLNSSNASYAEFSGKSFNSNAVYAGIASSGSGKYIQLRSNKSDAGIVSTTSGGKLKSVTITFNSSTTDRGIDIYGKNEAYTNGPEMYGDAKGELIGTIYANGESMTVSPTNDYAYVGMVAHNGAIYVDKITIVWEGEGGQVQTKTATAIEFSGDYLTKFTPGKDGEAVDLPTATVKAGDAVVEGATVTWTLTKSNNWSADSDPVINGTKVEFGDHSRGDLTLKASYAGNDNYEASNKSYTIKVYKGYMAIKSILEDFPTVGSDTWKAKEAEWKAGTPISYWQVDAKSETEFTSKEALVTFVSGQYTYIKDNDGCLLLYGNSLGFNKGDKISGDLGNDKGFGAIYGTLKTYNGLLELATSKNDIEFVVKSSDNAVEAKTITVDQLTQENMNEFVKIQNVEFVSADKKNLTFKVGDVNVAVYNQFNVDITDLEAGAMYDLYGMGCIYYKDEVVTPQLYLVEFEKAGNSVESGVIYSWESPEGTPIETGGTIAYVNGDGDRLNYQNGNYYTICLNGKKANMNDETASANAGKMVVTLDNALAADDVISFTGYITKNESKKASAYILYENGANAESPVFSDAENIDPKFGGSIATKTVTVAEEAAGSKTITLTRGQTGTNLFITKLEIIRGTATGISTVKTQKVQDNAIYNLAGQKVGNDYKGLVIMNGRKFMQK